MVSYQTSGELDGTPWSFLTFVMPNLKADTGIVGFGIDMTEVRLARETEERVRAQMENAQKLESLGVLAGGIAHDFNNLLTSMLGYSSLALTRIPTDSPVRGDIAKIEQAAQTAADLCKQLLAYSGKGRFVVRPVNLSKLCQETVGLLQVSIPAHATLRLDCPLDLPLIDADSPQIQQVLMNLVINAAESLNDKGGTVSVTTGSTLCEEGYFNGAYPPDPLPPGRYVFAEVSDTGCGMDADTVAKIFDPFFSTKQTGRGRGLGLAAVVGIVRGHRGAIMVHSEPGRGTTFKALFPISDSDRLDESPEPSLNATSTGATVLFVDDERSVREIGCEMLESAGHRVIVACDGKEAVEVFSSRSDIDLVIIDMMMPKMSGVEAFKRFHQLDASIPVVLSSGYNEQEIVGELGGRTLAGFLQKPYRVQDLLDAVDRALGLAKR